MTTDINESLDTDAAALFEASRGVHKPDIHRVVGENADAYVLLAPDRMKVAHTITIRHATPSTPTGESAHQTMESLIAHVARHKDADSVAWLNVSGASASLRVVYDYHRASNTTPITEPVARWCERTASYVFPVSDQFKAWRDISGKAMTQDVLATFLEAHITELRDRSSASPRVMDIARALVATEDDTTVVTDDAARGIIASPSQMLRMARRVAMEVNTFAEEDRDEHGNVSIIYRNEATATEVKGGVKTTLTVPHLVIVEVPVLNGGTPYRLPVRLTMKVASNRVQWTLTVHRADLAMEDAINDASVAFAGATGLPVFRGTAEPAPTAK